MPLSEFELIRRFFSPPAGRSDVLLGVGDDCALLATPAGYALAVSIDTLVEGTHFLRGVDPESLGHKALAVSLSDLAAMGAQPAWVTLALTLPHSDDLWLEAFSQGFSGLASAQGVELVGGDITRGPRSVSVQAHGFVKPERALRRGGASPGELIYVTGTLGEAGLALLALQGLYLPPEGFPQAIQRLERPRPRVAEGLALCGLATAAIDISDGLAADLGHILEASDVGATVYVERIPLARSVRTYLRETGDRNLPLSAGDDYELCITVPADRRSEVERLGASFDCGLTWIGTVDAQRGLRCRLDDGRLMKLGSGGFDHFG